MAVLSGVIWDMDGVLVDSGEFHYQSWRNTLADYQLPYSREFFDKTFGMNNESILKLLGGENFNPRLIREIGERKEATFRRLVGGRVKTLPGVIPLLESVKGAGIPQAIASSAPQANIDVLVQELGLGDYFSAVISGAEMPGKPDPGVFLKAAAEIHTPPSECVVIEDGIPGVEAALRAGMKCIALTTTNSEDRLSAAHLVLSSLDEITLADLKTLVCGSHDTEIKSSKVLCDKKNNFLES